MKVYVVVEYDSCTRDFGGVVRVFADEADAKKLCDQDDSLSYDERDLECSSSSGKGAFAELVERETNAAIAHADEQDAKFATGKFCPTEEEVARHRR